MGSKPNFTPTGHTVGRYVLFGEIASGGMATVHFGRLSGPAGFSRTVAIKRLHPNLAKDPEFVTMFLDEARLAGRLRHPNVVPILDVESTGNEIFLVMEYVHGESLAKLRRAMQSAEKRVDVRIVATIMSGVLHGLHAAHEAKDEAGRRLDIVHRDVSPQNILVGIDGVARVLDFGVAKAIGRVQITKDGRLKGKLGYMSPEQLQGGAVTRQADVYAAAVAMWELLTGERLFFGDHEATIVGAVLQKKVVAPSQIAPHLSPEIDRIVLRGLERDPSARYATAREMAVDLERAVGVASTSEVGEWVEGLARTELAARARTVGQIEVATVSPSLPPASRVLRHEQPTRRSIVAVSELAGHTPEGVADVSQFAGGRTTPPAETLVWNAPRKVAWAGIGGALMALGFSLALALPRGAMSPGHGRAGADTSPVQVTLPHEPSASSAAMSPPLASPSAGPAEALPASAATSSPAASWPPATSSPGGWVAASLPAAGPAGSDETPPAVNAASLHAVQNSAHPAARPSLKRDCDPPYTIDEKQHKHYKAACL